MTRDQHYEEYKRLNAIAREHLNNSIENKENGFDRSEYEAYREASKQSRKHRGIALAMDARRNNKLYA